MPLFDLINLEKKMICEEDTEIIDSSPIAVSSNHKQSENCDSDQLKSKSQKLSVTTSIPGILNCFEYDVDKLDLAQNMVICKGCSKKIAFKLGDPSSNLHRHLTKSNSLSVKHEGLLKDNKTIQSPNRGVKRAFIEIDRNSSPSPQKLIKNFDEYKPKDPKKIKLDLKLCHLIVSKSLPLSLVDSSEFRGYSSALDQRYKPMTSQTLKGTLIPRCKNELKTHLIEKLSKVSSINLVTDIWTDQTMRSFIGFDVQGIDDDWERFKYNINSKQLTGSHNNEKIFQSFMETVNEFKIGDKIFKIVSDGASNMVKAFNKEHIDEYIDNFLDLCETSEDLGEEDDSNLEETDDVENKKTEEEISSDKIADGFCENFNNVSRLNCTAHRLQLAISDALKFDNALDLVKKISKIINKGRHSTQVMDQLRENKKYLKTKNDTRWNSVFYMMKSFSKLSNAEIETILSCGKKNKKLKKNEELKFLRMTEIE